MISTTEMHVLKRVLELEPNLRRGWTYPKAGRDYNRRQPNLRRPSSAQRRTPYLGL